MRRIIRGTLSVLVLLSAAVAIHYFCIEPLRCHLAEARLEQLSLQLVERPDRPDMPRQARANLGRAIACIRVEPRQVNFYMIAAVNCRLLGLDERAIEFYERALRYDRRPELYAALGNAQSKVGRREEAIANLLRANIFWPYTLNDIEDPFVHDEVERRYKEYEAALTRRR